ncbi:hypothetical protein [Roseibium sp. MMSF_3412]|uniref:hypothetical protein n=1 Tax=Roseibium sp. MMSF_3412 TaxID=3046712 RepID=UPI00273E6533|nr:hypothetical protein [Roseibium sp. MMSF_3412]
MTGPEERKDLKSIRAGKPMRSRGFLSHSGGQSGPDGETAGGSTASPASRKSQGMKQAVPQTDAKPRELTPKTTTKPYRLEDT